MRKAFLAAVCAAAMWATPAEVQAAPFSFNWTDTVSGGSFDGDSFTFTIVVDNGGTTTASQTWTADDFVSASINVNGGAFTGTLITSFGTGGVFQTDAGSAIIAVPTDWYGEDDDTGYWYINGFNNIWWSGEVTINAANVGGNQNPANWSIDAPSEVPEPSTWLLFGAGLTMAAIRRRKHIRS